MTTTMTSDICEIITKYIQKPRYELLDWINIEDLNFEILSANSNAIELLKENQDKVKWSWLSSNPSIFKKIYNNDDKAIIQKTLEIILIKSKS